MFLKTESLQNFVVFLKIKKQQTNDHEKIRITKNINIIYKGHCYNKVRIEIIHVTIWCVSIGNIPKCHFWAYPIKFMILSHTINVILMKIYVKNITC